MKSILKPCPFCGGEARVMLEEEDEPDAYFHNIYCTGCWAQFWVKSKAEAIAAWNRRAQPENEPIVRCGECIHFEPYDGEEHKGNCNELVGLDSCMYEDDYCSYGERKPERSEG